MTTVGEIWNLQHPDVALPSWCLDDPDFAKLFATTLTVGDQIDYITTVGNAPTAHQAAHRLLSQLHDGYLRWDAQGNLNILGG